MLPSFATDTAVRVRPEWVTDSRNVRKSDWANADRLDVFGCLVTPGASDETLGGRDTVTIRWTVHMPAGADVVATDALEVHGRRYSVDGEPQAVRSPTGGLDHVLVLLVDWKG